MKIQNLMNLSICLTCITLFVGCGGQSTEEIVKKYDTYGRPDVDGAKLRLSDFALFEKAAIIEIGSDNPELTGIRSNVDLLSERFIALDAENPTRELTVYISTQSVEYNEDEVGVYYITRLILQEPKAKVVLIVFSPKNT